MMERIDGAAVVIQSDDEKRLCVTLVVCPPRCWLLWESMDGVEDGCLQPERDPPGG